MIIERLFILAAGLMGAAGVALAAAAAHQSSDNLETAARFLLLHAPALLAIGLFGRGLMLRTGGSVLLAGVLLFSGDLAMRHYAGGRLFPFAAPTGGTLMIGGWILVGLSALVRPHRRPGSEPR
jgi:uncharacterized membrane protein YgdD (TMEM256/DUF423 family)